MNVCPNPRSSVAASLTVSTSEGATTTATVVRMLPPPIVFAWTTKLSVPCQSGFGVYDQEPVATIRPVGVVVLAVRDAVAVPFAGCVDISRDSMFRGA